MTAADLIPRQIATECPTCRGQGLVIPERWGVLSGSGATTRQRCGACYGTGRTERLESPVEVWRRAATERGMRPPHVGSSWDEIVAELALDVIELVDRVTALEQPVRVSFSDASDTGFGRFPYQVSRADADGVVRIEYRGADDTARFGLRLEGEPTTFTDCRIACDAEPEPDPEPEQDPDPVLVDLAASLANALRNPSDPAMLVRQSAEALLARLADLGLIPPGVL